MPYGARIGPLIKDKAGAFVSDLALKFDVCHPYFYTMNSTPTAPKRLHAKGLVKQYGQRKVVDGISLEVKEGEVVGLLCPNGAGKTTSFYTVVGLVQADAGQVFIDDVEITDRPMYQRGRMGLGYLPQEPSVFRKLSVEDNI